MLSFLAILIIFNTQLCKSNSSNDVLKLFDIYNDTIINEITYNELIKQNVQPQIIFKKLNKYDNDTILFYENNLFIKKEIIKQLYNDNFKIMFKYSNVILDSNIIEIDITFLIGSKNFFNSNYLKNTIENRFSKSQYFYKNEENLDSCIISVFSIGDTTNYIELYKNNRIDSVYTPDSQYYQKYKYDNYGNLTNITESFGHSINFETYEYKKNILIVKYTKEFKINYYYTDENIIKYEIWKFPDEQDIYRIVFYEHN